MKKNKKTEEEPDFDFSKIEKEIDKRFSKQAPDEEKISHISEKIREGIEIKENLPEPDFLRAEFDEVVVTTEKDDGTKKEEKGIRVTSHDTDGKKHVSVVKGLFNLDLRNDAAWWFIRTPILNPQIYKQAIRTHLDIKKCHDPTKRKLEIPYLLIAVLVIGAVIIGISFLTMMMK